MTNEIKYNSAYHPQEVTRIIGEDNLLNDELAQALDISLDMLNQWKKDYPEFDDAVQIGLAKMCCKLDRQLNAQINRPNQSFDHDSWSAKYEECGRQINEALSPEDRMLLG